jgi:hypothetical protein
VAAEPPGGLQASWWIRSTLGLHHTDIALRKAHDAIGKSENVIHEAAVGFVCRSFVHRRRFLATKQFPTKMNRTMGDQS